MKIKPFFRFNSLKFTFEDFSSPQREEVIIPDMASLMAGVSPITSASSTMKRTHKVNSLLLIYITLFLMRLVSVFKEKLF